MTGGDSGRAGSGLTLAPAGSSLAGGASLISPSSASVKVTASNCCSSLNLEDFSVYLIFYSMAVIIAPVNDAKISVRIKPAI